MENKVDKIKRERMDEFTVNRMSLTEKEQKSNPQKCSDAKRVKFAEHGDPENENLINWIPGNKSLCSISVLCYSFLFPFHFTLPGAVLPLSYNLRGCVYVLVAQFCSRFFDDLCS
jgi:hypothetical protein